MKTFRPISDHNAPETKCPWTHIALLRGADWLAADRPKHLIIRTHAQQDITRPIHADLLTINPFLTRAWLQRSDCTDDSFSMLVEGNIALIPAGAVHSTLPVIAATTIRAICDAETFDTSLKSTALSKGILVAGHCGWFDQAWCASPLGYRNESGLWTQFLVSGGAGGLAFDLDQSVAKGIGIKSMSEVTKEVQLFGMLAEAFKLRFPQLNSAVVMIDECTIRHAAILVAVRKAVGPYALRVSSVQNLSPPWKRLLQHLNGVLEVSVAERPSIALSTLAKLFEKIDFDLLIQQINRHSQVIPHGMLK